MGPEGGWCWMVLAGRLCLNPHLSPTNILFFPIVPSHGIECSTISRSGAGEGANVGSVVQCQVWDIDFGNMYQQVCSLVSESVKWPLSWESWPIRSPDTRKIASSNLAESILQNFSFFSRAVAQHPSPTKVNMREHE